MNRPRAGDRELCALPAARERLEGDPCTHSGHARHRDGMSKEQIGKVRQFYRDRQAR